MRLKTAGNSPQTQHDGEKEKYTPAANANKKRKEIRYSSVCQYKRSRTEDGKMDKNAPDR